MKKVNLLFVLVLLVLFATAGCESGPVRTQVVYVPIQPTQATDNVPYQQPQIIIPQYQSQPVIIQPQQPQSVVVIQPERAPHHQQQQIRVPREVPCIACGGTGKIICSVCGGRGYQNVICGNCHGTGKTPLGNTCPFCDGTGNPRCTGCYSWPNRGYHICGTCGGTGRIIMP